MKSEEFILESKNRPKNLIVFDIDDTLWNPLTGESNDSLIEKYKSSLGLNDSIVVLLTARGSKEKDSDILPSQLQQLGIDGAINFAGDIDGKSDSYNKVAWLDKNFDLNNFKKIVVYDDKEENLSAIEQLADKFNNLQIKTIQVTM